MGEKITAVVVTYNRLNLLKECINTLRGQTRKLDGIIVINNNSTDGTNIWLSQQNDLIVYNQENIGGAGGFYRGIKEGYEKGYDWIWAMDDDAFPNPDCLMNLINSEKFSKDHDVVLAPLVLDNNEIDHLHRGIVDLDASKMIIQAKIDTNFYRSNVNDINVSFISFVGIFIGRNVIKKVGYPKSEYFIFCDDLEYSIRIVRSGFKMYLNKKAIISHRTIQNYTQEKLLEIFNKPESPVANTTLSKKLKNKIDSSKLFNELSARTIYSYIGQRNLIFTLITYKGYGLKVVLFVISNLFNSFINIFFSKKKILKKLNLLLHAYKQGITGKFKTSYLLSFQEE